MSRHFNQELVDTYQHTKKYCINKQFPNTPSMVYDIRKLSINSTDTNDIPKIIVKNTDSFEMARELVGQNYNPLVLNLASDFKAGGGVEKGSKSQEEDLFRKSSYFMNMISFVGTDGKKIKFPYPLSPHTVIYSPDVYICKDMDYNLLKEPVHVSCLAVPALRHPQIKYDGKLERYRKADDRTIMKSKIEAIFQIAILNKHDSLVLGALGCGVFANPVHDVVELFREAIVKYGKSFRLITFAVLICKNTDMLNLECFQILEKD